MAQVKFIPGFIVTIGIYLGLSIVLGYLDPAVSDVFADVPALLYGNLGKPSVLVLFSSILNNEIYLALESVLPVGIAALLGSLVERKSGKVSIIFASTFLGLMTCAVLGAVLVIPGWPAGGIDLYQFGGNTYNFQYWQWFLPASLIIGALNALFWSSIGLGITSKTWD